jgi:hypothetical protein
MIADNDLLKEEVVEEKISSSSQDELTDLVEFENSCGNNLPVGYKRATFFGPLSSE